MNNIKFPDKLPEDQRLCLQKFRRIVGHLHPSFDDHFLFRFLKARNFNLEKAEYMIREHFKFRSTMGIDTILTDFQLPEVLAKYFPYYYIGTDKYGNGVVGFLPGRIDEKGFVNSLPVKDHIKSLLYIIEEIFYKMRKENEKKGQENGKLIFIADFQGVNLMAFCNKQLAKLAIREILVMDRNYPEFLESAYFINVPSLFHPWLNFAKKITGSEALKKLITYGTTGWKEELLKLVHSSVLPAIFGGDLCDPDGSRECRTMFVEGGKIPEDLYANDKHLSSLPETDVRNVIVREKSYFNEEVFVKESNTIIRWSFETIDNNIGFAVYHVPSGVKPMPKTSVTNFSKSFRHRVARDPKQGHIDIVPLERINSHYIVEEGEICCQKPGIYLFHFDNTFSWITPKHLYYKIDVILAKDQDIKDKELAMIEVHPFR